jgi:hypothetical protein
MFKKLDGNGDGKLTKDEMSSGMKKLADALDSQFNQMRMNGTAQAGQGGSTPPPGGMPPPGGKPPPPSDGGGANATAATSGASSTQSSSSTKTYDPADANQDGTVSEQERIAYAQAKQDNASASGDAGSSTTSANSDARVLKQIMDLMHAYSSFDSSSSNSGLSVTA